MTARARRPPPRLVGGEEEGGGSGGGDVGAEYGASEPGEPAKRYGGSTWSNCCGAAWNGAPVTPDEVVDGSSTSCSGGSSPGVVSQIVVMSSFISDESSQSRMPFRTLRRPCGRRPVEVKVRNQSERTSKGQDAGSEPLSGPIVSVRADHRRARVPIRPRRDLDADRIGHRGLRDRSCRRLARGREPDCERRSAAGL